MNSNEYQVSREWQRILDLDTTTAGQSEPTVHVVKAGHFEVLP